MAQQHQVDKFENSIQSIRRCFIAYIIHYFCLIVQINKMEETFHFQSLINNLWCIQWNIIHIYTLIFDDIPVHSIQLKFYSRSIYIHDSTAKFGKKKFDIDFGIWHHTNSTSVRHGTDYFSRIPLNACSTCTMEFELNPTREIRFIFCLFHTTNSSPRTAFFSTHSTALANVKYGEYVGIILSSTMDLHFPLDSLNEKNILKYSNAKILYINVVFGRDVFSQKGNDGTSTI